MMRDEAIRRLQDHEVELRRLGVNACTCSAPSRVAISTTLPTSICSSTTKMVNSVYSV